VTKLETPAGESLINPPKSITTLAVQEISVVDFVFHTRFVIGQQVLDSVSQPDSRKRVT